MTRTHSTVEPARPAAAARASAFAGAPFRPRPRARLLAGTVLAGGTLRDYGFVVGGSVTLN